MNEFLVRETALVNGTVNVQMNIPLTPAGPKPTLIALVGDMSPLQAGFIVVTYTVRWDLIQGNTPAAPAEATVGKWVLASPSAAVLGERYLRQIAATANEYVPAIIDWLETMPEVDAARIGMVGGSTNGFVTLQAVAADRRIWAAVAIAACGDYLGFLQNSSMGMEGKPLALDPVYAQWVRSQQIIEHPDRLVHAALLMTNRIGDELIPIGCADETARVLTEAFARAGRPDHFRFVRIEGAGHGIGTEERQEVQAWFDKWR